jgi:hypothetical protein
MPMRCGTCVLGQVLCPDAKEVRVGVRGLGSAGLQAPAVEIALPAYGTQVNNDATYKAPAGLVPVRTSRNATAAYSA